MAAFTITQTKTDEFKWSIKCFHSRNRRDHVGSHVVKGIISTSLQHVLLFLGSFWLQSSALHKHMPLKYSVSKFFSHIHMALWCWSHLISNIFFVSVLFWLLIISNYWHRAACLGHKIILWLFCYILQLQFEFLILLQSSHKQQNCC